MSAPFLPISCAAGLEWSSRWRWLGRRPLLTAWNADNCEGSDINVVVLVLLKLLVLPQTTIAGRR